MSIPRIFIHQPLKIGAVLTLESQAAHHLFTVLRLKVGAEVWIFNNQAQEYTSKIIVADRNQVTLQIVNLSKYESASGLQLHLIIGISKAERMDMVLQKATELGVMRISPMLAQRSVVQLQGIRLERRNLHWQQTIIAACEQSGRCRLPQLDHPQDIVTCLNATQNDQKLLLHPSGSATLSTIVAPRQGVTLFVGPEGGLDANEVQQAQTAGFIALRLGPRILRTETAPLAALAAIQTLWGDFR